MIPAAVDLLACPACGQDLHEAGRSLRCASGHVYDLAKQGYVNLLNRAEPANADTAEMLAARARVHAAGVFSQVSDAVADKVAGRSRVLEVGAGTGHYLQQALGDDPARVGIALDVSKAAAKVAARCDPRIASVVADVWQGLPVRDRCLDAVLCVFAPRNFAEFARVLRSDGRLVVVTPQPGHLSELRQRHDLLDVPADKAEAVTVAASEFFEPVSVTGLQRTRGWPAEVVADVIAMGPNAFHRLPERVESGTVSVAVTITAFAPLPG